MGATHFIDVDGLGELVAPELERVFQRDADALDEEAVLHAAAVFQVVLRAQRLVQVAHTQRVRLFRQLLGKKETKQVHRLSELIE